jgi:ABC-type transport system substrate-binding protein
MEYLKANTAAGGAFKVESWRPGTEIILSRFDGWKSGSLPPMRRIIWRDVPSAGSRLALMERGDADISYGVPPKDAKEIATGKRARKAQDRWGTHPQRHLVCGHERQEPALQRRQGTPGCRLCPTL